MKTRRIRKKPEYFQAIPSEKRKLANTTKHETKNFIIPRPDLRRIPEKNLKRKTKSSGFNFETKRNETLFLVRQGFLNITEMCLGCGTEAKIAHPHFLGGLCKSCEKNYVKCMSLYDENAKSLNCCVCSQDQSLLSCDQRSCTKSFCRLCLEALVGPGTYQSEVKKAWWKCYLCRKQDCHGLLQRLNDVTALEFVNRPVSLGDHVIRPAIAEGTQVKKTLKVLLLFSGIEENLEALKQLNIAIDEYYVCHIKQKTAYTCPEFQDVVDVVDLTEKKLLQLGPIDLLLGGIPSNDLGDVNSFGKMKGFDKIQFLFLEYFRILSICNLMAAVNNQHFFWLFESNMNLEKGTKVRMARFFNQYPTKHITGAGAKLYWGSLPEMRNVVRDTSTITTSWDWMESEVFASSSGKKNTRKVPNTKLHGGVPIMRQLLTPLKKFFIEEK